MMSSRQNSFAVDKLLLLESSGLRAPSLGRTASSFDENVFVSPNFKPEPLIAQCRQKVSLPTLKGDLQNHLRTLKKDLVELINRDYADFVNLSANLVGLDRAIASIRDPLTKVREEIMEVREEVQNAMETLDAKLAERSLIREKKALLQLYLNIGDSVHKIEKLMGLTENALSAAEANSNTDTVQRQNSVSREAEDTGQMTERVAAEYNQLMFYLSQCADLPFVKQYNERIQQLNDMLLASIESMLRSGLDADDMAAVEQALKVFSIIDNASHAETLYMTSVVDPFMQKTITPTELQRVGLDAVLANVLSFVTGPAAKVTAITRKPGLQRFDILTRSVWPSFAATVQRKIPTIFAPGMPDVFFKNYTATMRFVTSFEAECSSQAGVQRLRESQAFVDFMKLFSLPIYFQLRFQEIAGELEDSLVDSPSVPEKATAGSLVMPMSAQLVSCISKAWQDGVYLPVLAHRFWKLYLQLNARYLTWLRELPRPSSSLQSDENSEQKVDISLDPVIVCQYLISDCRVLKGKLGDLQMMIQSRLEEAARVPPAFVTEGNEEIIASIAQVEPQLAESITKALTAQCTHNLKPVWRVTATYRMTNKEMPSEPSDFVAGILEPLATVLILKGEFVTPGEREKWARDVLEPTTSRYAEITSEVLSTVNKTEASLLRLRKTRKKKEGGAAALGTDEDKIRRQLFLDAEAFGMQIERFGIQRGDIAAYNALWASVQEGNPAQAHEIDHPEP